MITGDTAGLHPVLAQRLSDLAGRVNISVTSGHRSSAEQKRLYDGWVARRPGFNPANPPGTSNHEAIPWGPARALAADIAGDLAGAHRLAGALGLGFPLAREPWHIQMVESRSPSYERDPFPDTSGPVPSSTEVGILGAVAAIADQHEDARRDAILATVRNDT